MPNLSDLKKIYGLEIKQIVRKNVLPSKEIQDDPLPSRPTKTIKTNREHNKDQLMNLVNRYYNESKDKIPIEKMRSLELEMRIIKER